MTNTTNNNPTEMMTEMMTLEPLTREQLIRLRDVTEQLASAETPCLASVLFRLPGAIDAGIRFDPVVRVGRVASRLRISPAAAMVLGLDRVAADDRRPVDIIRVAARHNVDPVVLADLIGLAERGELMPR